MQRISLIVLIISFLALAAIFFKKAPQLTEVKANISGKKEKNILFQFRKKIADISFIRSFSWNSFLQKILSRTRILILKIENKIENYLHFLRKNSKKKKK